MTRSEPEDYATRQNGDPGPLFSQGEPSPAAENVAALFGHTREGIEDAARAFLAARQKKEDTEEHLKKANAALEEAQDRFLAALEEAGVAGLKLDEGGQKVGLAAATSDYYSLPQGGLDDSQVLSWLLKAGGHDLVKRSVNHMSFSKFCRELAEQGRGIHPAVKVLRRRVVRVVKS